MGVGQNSMLEKSARRVPVEISLGHYQTEEVIL
jgi:hypothetical protein